MSATEGEISLYVSAHDEQELLDLLSQLWHRYQDQPHERPQDLDPEGGAHALLTVLGLLVTYYERGTEKTRTFQVVRFPGGLQSPEVHSVFRQMSMLLAQTDDPNTKYSICLQAPRPWKTPTWSDCKRRIVEWIQGEKEKEETREEETQEEETREEEPLQEEPPRKRPCLAADQRRAQDVVSEYAWFQGTVTAQEVQAAWTVYQSAVLKQQHRLVCIHPRYQDTISLLEHLGLVVRLDQEDRAGNMIVGLRYPDNRDKSNQIFDQLQRQVGTSQEEVEVSLHVLSRFATPRARELATRLRKQVRESSNE